MVLGSLLEALHTFRSLSKISCSQRANVVGLSLYLIVRPRVAGHIHVTTGSCTVFAIRISFSDFDIHDQTAL